MKLFKNFLIINLATMSLYANSTSLRDAVEQTINTNPDILAEHYNIKASRTNIEEQRRDYYPTLDFQSFIEDSTTTDNRDDTGKQAPASKDGWNATFKFEQVLYDGGQTPNEIEQYTHRYNNIKHTSKDTVESLILDTINTYNRLVSYQELKAYDKVKIEIHEKYLQLAKEKADISGELLDWYQVKSKINAIMDNYLEQEVNQQKALSQYKKLTTSELKGNICRPVLDESVIPDNIHDAIRIALRNNSQIKAQIELIKEQVARQRTKAADFRPTIKFQAESFYDDDIELPENGRRDIQRLRLNFSWNLFNGGKDTIAHQREKIFSLQEKKLLDAITNDVIDKIKGSYNTFYKKKKRIQNIKEFIINNEKIVEIYNKQLEDGSRTFLDLLNAEAELFRTKVLLINTEFSLYEEYYKILKELNMLSDSILNSKQQICKPYELQDSVLNLIKKEEKTDDELADELGL